MGRPKKTETSKTVRFKDQVLSRLNKSEEQVQEEQITDKIADFIIDAESQISIIETSEIPKQEQSLVKAKRELEKASKSLEDAYYNLKVDRYEYYVENINRLSERVRDHKADILNIQSKISNLNAQVKAHKEILARLKS